MKNAVKRTTRWTGNLVKWVVRGINPADGRMDRSPVYRGAQWCGIVASLIIFPGLIALIILFVIPLVFSIIAPFLVLWVAWLVFRIFFFGNSTDHRSAAMLSGQQGNYEANKQKWQNRR
ncbi:hypothetical protein E7Z53_18145 [Kocuria salina]|uniref:hypothetical protein n=1 Tax=Kocuria salina TaxID=1929416 RepID=UPI001593D790|nr:hypothetical protein [Kocuria salina]NVC25341.1 hypothetical protein [Kocuria salina]